MGEIAKRWGNGERKMSRLANKPKQKGLDAVSGLAKRIKDRDMVNKNIKLVTEALKHSDIVVLNGGVASGKSSVISKIVPKQLIITKKLLALHGENIEVLTSDLMITRSSGNEIVAIDEAQLFNTDQLLTLVNNAVANKTKVIIAFQKIHGAYLARLESSLGENVNMKIIELSLFDREVEGGSSSTSLAKSGKGLSIPVECTTPAPKDNA